MQKKLRIHNRIFMDKSRGQDNSNKGFSLIELIVVIAVMVVVTGFIVYGVSVLSSGDANKASKTIYNQLTSTQRSTLSMSGKWSLEIINNSGTNTLNIYRDDGTGNQLQTSEKLGSRIELSYNTKNDEASAQQLGNGDRLIVTFERSTGKILDVTKNGSSIYDSGKTDLYIMAKGRGSSSNYTVKVIYATGKIISEN